MNLRTPLRETRDLVRDRPWSLGLIAWCLIAGAVADCDPSLTRTLAVVVLGVVILPLIALASREG